MTPKVHVLDLDFQGQALAIFAFLIETDDGPVLIECGPHSSFVSLEKAIGKFGYVASDIQHVFLTHIHLDHAGAAWCFAEHGANIYLHPLGYKHMHDPSKLLDSATRIYGDMMEQLWGTLKPIPADQLVQAQDGDSYTVGDHSFEAIHSPGHAKHHIAWKVGDTLFTGDVAGVRIHNGPIVPPCPPPDINIEHWEASINTIMSREDIKRYYLTHGGLVTDLEYHMSKLNELLHSYADFIKPYYDKGVSQGDIMEPFQEFVAEDLREQGINESVIEAYHLANPVFMSVAGLMRYWHKKTQNA